MNARHTTYQELCITCSLRGSCCSVSLAVPSFCSRRAHRLPFRNSNLCNNANLRHAILGNGRNRHGSFELETLYTAHTFHAPYLRHCYVLDVAVLVISLCFSCLACGADLSRNSLQTGWFADLPEMDASQLSTSFSCAQVLGRIAML